MFKCDVGLYEVIVTNSSQNQKFSWVELKDSPLLYPNNCSTLRQKLTLCHITAIISGLESLAIAQKA